MISFGGLTAEPALLSLIEKRFLGGVILYSRNCRSASQVRSLTSQLQRASRFPMIVSIDQEGGAVIRIRNGVHTFPSEAIYGKIGSAARVYADASTTAHDLRALGLTMNVAPVVDVLSNPSSPIGNRSFGANPNLDARLIVAAIQGYQQHGLAAVAKHFVGLGHASMDSHGGLPTVGLTLAQFDRDDFIPFRAAIRAGVSALLVAHVALPDVDHVHRPASLSPVVIGSVLRGRLGFKGVVMTDSLLMGALPNGQGSEAAERAFAAGADILLLATDHNFPHGVVEDAMARVAAAVKGGRISEARLDASLVRIASLKKRF
jgi:beta-N-acetylhexosaminidase